MVRGRSGRRIAAQEATENLERWHGSNKHLRYNLTTFLLPSTPRLVRCDIYACRYRSYSFLFLLLSLPYDNIRKLVSEGILEIFLNWLAFRSMVV